MNKTIFVLLDACQYEAGTRNLGFLEHLIDQGKGAKYKVLGELPSLSRPIYATLLTGLPVCEHGITYNEVSDTLDVPSVFSLCKAAGGITAAAAYHWVSELFNDNPFRPHLDRIQINAKGAIDHGIYYWEDMYPDSHVFADGEYLRRAFDPDFLMLHTMCIDYMGHAHGANSEPYEKSIAIAGHVIAASLPRWLKEGYNVVITADHGINHFGIHGGTDAPQRDTPLYIFSNQVKTGRFEDHYISQLDVAPMMCRLLGTAVAPAMKQSLDIVFHQSTEI